MAQVVTCTAAAFFFGEGLRVSAASKKVSEPALIGACPFCVELCMGSFSSEITSATWFTLDCGSFSTLLNTSTRAGMMEAGVLEEVSRASLLHAPDDCPPHHIVGIMRQVEEVDICNLTWENRKKSSCYRWPNGTRRVQQCTLYDVSTS